MPHSYRVRETETSRRERNVVKRQHWEAAVEQERAQRHTAEVVSTSALAQTQTPSLHSWSNSAFASTVVMSAGLAAP
jgi:hypothetical protein